MLCSFSLHAMKESSPETSPKAARTIIQQLHNEFPTASIIDTELEKRLANVYRQAASIPGGKNIQRKAGIAALEAEKNKIREELYKKMGIPIPAPAVATSHVPSIGGDLIIKINTSSDVSDVHAKSIQTTIEPLPETEEPFRCLLSPKAIWSQKISDDERERLSDIESLDARSTDFNPLEWVKAFYDITQLKRTSALLMLESLEKIMPPSENPLITKSKAIKLAWLRELVAKEKGTVETPPLPAISTPSPTPTLLATIVKEEPNIKTPPVSMIVEMATALVTSEKSTSVDKETKETPVEEKKSVIPAYINSSIAPQDKLYRAIFNDSPEEIRLAIESGAVVNDVYAPLLKAILLARSNAVEALLKHKANPKIFCYTNTNQHLSSVTAHPHLYSFKLVHYAAFLGDMKSALSLIKYGADFGGDISEWGSGRTGEIINHTDIMGIVLGNYSEDSVTCLQLIQLLFDRGYKINQTEWKNNIWYMAIWPQFSCGKHGHNDTILDEPLIKLLVKNGADMNAPIVSISNPYGHLTPLGIAILNGNTPAISSLLKAGANVHQPFSEIISAGRRRSSSRIVTPLAFVASRRENLKPATIDEIMKLLRKYGAKK